MWTWLRRDVLSEAVFSMEQFTVRDTTTLSRDLGGDPTRRGHRPIADYAMVGDEQSGALIASDGGVDWLCLPHVDSPAILCRLLDSNRGGFLAISPEEPPLSMTRSYRPASNVLDTTFVLPDGGGAITDAMPFAVDDPTPPLDGIWGGRGRHRMLPARDRDGSIRDASAHRPGRLRLRRHSRPD